MRGACPPLLPKADMQRTISCPLRAINGHVLLDRRDTPKSQQTQVRPSLAGLPDSGGTESAAADALAVGVELHRLSAQR
jgi:hypothetical protein